MIKQLRSKIIRFNMIFVSIVLLSIIASILYSNYSRGYKDTQQFLHAMLDDSPVIKGPSHMVHLPYPSNFFALKATLSSDMKIESYDIRGGHINRTSIENLISKVNIKKLGQRQMVYSQMAAYIVDKNSDKNGYIVAFIDVSRDYSRLIETSLFSLLLFSLGFIAFYFVSQLLANIALRPVEEAWQKQQHFIADASHELKTPLTIMLTTTYLFKNTEDNLSNMQKRWIGIIGAEADRMHKLIEDMLFLARSDHAQDQVSKSPLLVKDMVEYTCLLFEPTVYEANKTLNTSISSNNYIMGNQDQLQQLLMILIDNAVKYGAAESSITVSLEDLGNKVAIKVNNQGSPIPKDELPLIFDRFYRVDKARSRNLKSYGLGLPIAKEIVNKHNGKIEVVSDSTKGTTFTILLPIHYPKQ